LVFINQGKGVKMNYLRSVLVSSVVVAGICLTGFKKHIPEHDSSAKTHKPIEAIKQQKPLDLSVQFKDTSLGENTETLAVVPVSASETLSGNKSKARVVELQGNLIMSQEPEAEKTKSTDGAGILINLHH